MVEVATVDVLAAAAMRPDGDEDGSPRRVAPPRIPKMAEVIAAELRTKILAGELTPGESLLSESSLTDQYGVSRPTLREALRLLEAQNLIVVRRGSHRGPVVAHPDPSVSARALAIQLQLRDAGVGDVYAFRMLYEPAAVRLAATRVTAGDLAGLRGILDEAAACRGDAPAFAAKVWQFHSALIALSGNITMAVVTESLQHISASHAAKAMAVSADSEAQQNRSLQAHRKLLGLLEAHDADRAEAFWSDHMAAVAEIQRRSLGDQPVNEILV